MKAKHKFNDGNGATLCHKCNVVIDNKLTEDLYCVDCKCEILNEINGLIANWMYDCTTKHEPMHWNNIVKYVNEKLK